MIDLTVGLVLGVRMGADTSDASRTDSEASCSVMAVKVIVVRRGVGRCVLHVDWILCGRVDGWMMRGVTASVWSTGGTRLYADTDERIVLTRDGVTLLTLQPS